MRGKGDGQRERGRENACVVFEGKAIFITQICLIRSPLALESSQRSINRARGVVFIVMLPLELSILLLPDS
jgi:hypothetical protein